MKQFKTVYQLFIVLCVLFFVFNSGQAQFLGSVSGFVIEESSGDSIPYFPLRVTKTSEPGQGNTGVTASNAEGWYNIPLTQGSYLIEAVDTVFYEPFALNLDLESGEDTVIDLLVNIRPPDAVIEGHVSLNEEPVEGAEIFLLRIGDEPSESQQASPDSFDENKAVYKALSDADGNFLVDVVHGSYFLFVKGTEDYLPFWSSELFVAEGETLFVDINLEVNPIRTISGTVSNHELFDKVLVTAFPVSGGSSSAAPVDSATGEYKLFALSGVYVVGATGFLDGATYTIFYDNVKSFDDATPVDVTEGNVSGIDFRFPENLSLSPFVIQGQVTNEDTGEPLPGAFVSFLGKNHSSLGLPVDKLHHKFAVTTDENGEYTFVGKTFEDTVRVIGLAQKDSFFVEFYNDQPTFFTADEIVLAANDTVTGIDFTLERIPDEPDFSISGVVLKEDGSTIPLAWVIAYTNVGNKFTKANEDGSYEIPGLPLGTHVVVQGWGFPGYIPEFYDGNDGAASINDAQVLVMDEDKTGIDFHLAKAGLNNANGAISGKVEISNNSETNVTVYVRKAGDSKWLSADYADASGKFSLGIDGYGSYELKATAPGYQDYETSVTVDETTGPVVSDVNVNMTPTSIGDISENKLIESHQLYTAYPNPFNPSTTIKVDMAKTDKASLTIYNVLGQKVKILYQGILQQGSKEFSWNGTDDFGNTVATGLYFYQLKTPNTVQTRSVIFMK